MLRAAATLCFFGFFRSWEITVPSAGEFDPRLNSSDLGRHFYQRLRLAYRGQSASKTLKNRSGRQRR